MRKYLIVAMAALFTVAFTSSAFAAQSTANMEVKVTPTKAGTKKKKKNSKISLKIENTNTSATMSKLTITQPSTVKLSGKGLTKCAADVLETQGPSACPSKSRVGKGTAAALVGVNTPSPSPLTFDVTAIVTGNTSIGFFLAARELPVNVLAPGKISGNKLTIEVPQTAQQPAPSTWAGLVSLQTTLSAKKGKNYLVSSTGCKKKKHNYKAALTFANNGVSPAGVVNTSASAKCS